MRLDTDFKELRILTYNIHKGFSLGSLKFVLDQIRQGIVQTLPDLVCLQEVSGQLITPVKNNDQPSLASQFEFLADQVWPHFAYGKNAVYRDGDHGNAILSKFPIAAWKNLDISTNRFEKRGLLHCEVEINQGQKLHVLSSHLNLLEGSRLQQVAQIGKYIQSEIGAQEKLILAGDFNDWRMNANPLTFGLDQLNEAFQVHEGGFARSFPSFFPVLKLDRIYFRNLKLKEAWRLKGQPWNRLSDHIPLAASFEL
jgi:endonuclease/exonuclease/phosphatase family metal-dependent hydrolase